MRGRLGYRFSLNYHVLWSHILEYRYTVGLWLFLTFLDFSLTYVGLLHGARELNWFLQGLSIPTFALVKFSLAMVTILWLSAWGSLKYLKWLNVAFVILAISNIYELVRIVL